MKLATDLRFWRSLSRQGRDRGALAHELKEKITIVPDERPTNATICVSEGIYQPLDGSKRQIRLMRMLPAANEHDETIGCEVQIFSLDDNPVYSALSYCGTKAPPSETISLNGKSFPVQPNLHDYLRIRRHEENASDWIFIDAVCIDQDDENEKRAQLRLMSDVCQNATVVIAWVGIEVYMTMEQLIQYQQMHTPWAEDASLAVAFNKTFIKSSYWLRGWIVQEILLAKRLVVRCGQLTVDPEILFRHLTNVLVGSSFANSSSLPTPVSTSVDAFSAHMQAESKAMWILGTRRSAQDAPHVLRTEPLSKALDRYHPQLCTERHDVVFSLLSLTRSCIQPDYNMPILDLYLAVTIEAWLEMTLCRRHGAEDALGSLTYLTPTDVVLAMGALARSLDLRQSDRILALLALLTAELFNGKAEGRLVHRSLLDAHHEIWNRGIFKSTYGMFSKCHYRFLRAQLGVCQARDSALVHPDGPPGGMSYSAWMKKIENQAMVCCGLLERRELEHVRSLPESDRRIEWVREAFADIRRNLCIQ